MFPLAPRLCAALCAVLVAAPALAAAAAYPERPIRLVVPYPPGASTDVASRLIGQKVSESLGQPVIVDNRGGASGNIGSDFVAKSARDGYTILLGTDATHSGNYHLFRDMPYEPLKDFTPITLLARNVVVLAAHPSLPADDVAGLITYAKANPGKLSFGSSGVGSPHHLAGELFNQQAGTEILHVPYRGGGPALIDAVGGQILLVYSSLASVEPHLKSGKLKALGVTQQEPYAGIVPIGQTLPGFEMDSWLGFFAPAGTPGPVVERLHEAIAAALSNAQVAATLQTAGLVPVGSGPEAFGAMWREDFERRGKLIRAANIQAE